MEVKTIEIRRYVNLEFDEKDLQELRNDINDLAEWFKTNPYHANRDVIDKYKKLNEFYQVLVKALDEIHS